MIKTRSLLGSHRILIPLLVAVCFLSRLPQLITPYLHLDGDECVLGLMAQHMSLGHEFPFYFWGQSYGFSWIEAGSAAIAFKFFGVGILSLKIPMLLLWILGCIFLHGALSLWTTRVYSFWIISLFVLSPSWMAWSLKARGGYITSFLLSSILLFIIAKANDFLTKGSLLFIGILSGIILFSQPIFLIGILPILLYRLRKQGKFKDILICAVGFIGVYILAKVMLLLQSNTDFWNPGILKPNSIVHSIKVLGDRIYNGLSQYSSGRFSQPDWATDIVVKVWCIVFLICLVAQVIGWIVKKLSVLSSLFLMGVLCALGSTFIFGGENYADRYLISLSVFLILWFGIQYFEWMQKYSFLRNIGKVILGGLIVLGLSVAFNYKNYYRFDPKSASEVPEMQKIPQVIDFLRTYSVKHVYSIDDDLAWKILFFSREQIIARWMNLRARQPAYPVAVDKAFRDNQRIAVVGNAVDEKLAFLIVAHEGRTAVIAEQYFVHLAPTKELVVNKLRFEVN